MLHARMDMQRKRDAFVSSSDDSMVMYHIANAIRYINCIAESCVHATRAAAAPVSGDGGCLRARQRRAPSRWPTWRSARTTFKSNRERRSAQRMAAADASTTAVRRRTCRVIAFADWPAASPAILVVRLERRALGGEEGRRPSRRAVLLMAVLCSLAGGPPTAHTAGAMLVTNAVGATRVFFGVVT